jgi:hypothetical protein
MRPIEQQVSQWCTVKEAVARTGRDHRTVQRWIANGQVRTWKEPGGRLLLYKPDFLPPDQLPARNADGHTSSDDVERRNMP